MEVIVPCAGLSSRFPGMRPKYLLTDYQGRMMIESAVQNYIDQHSVTVVILKQHDQEYNATTRLKDAFGDRVSIVVLDQPTQGPADTVYQAIVQSKIPRNSQLLVKDCDGFYESPEKDGNVIYVSKLSKNPDIRNVAAKSYTVTNDQGIITTIVEKKIVSDSFCVGGYQFDLVQLFVEAYEKLQTHKEVFVSHVVDYLITQGEIFVENEVHNFVDVGTLADWREYNNRPTYFCDIDGTIVKSKFDYTDSPEPIVNNVNFLIGELNRGCKIVFVTSRPHKYQYLTRQMLDDLGFKNCQLITGIHHSKRILVNDFARTNPYPTAIAVNIPRDQNNLPDYL